MNTLNINKLHIYSNKVNNKFLQLDKENYIDTFKLLVYEILKYNIYNIMPQKKYIQDIQVLPYVILPFEGGKNTIICNNKKNSFSIYVAIKGTDTKEIIYYIEYLHLSLINMLNNLGIPDNSYIFIPSVNDDNNILTLYFEFL